MSRSTRAPDLPRILLEAFFVVLGVVLALAANEWRRDYSDRQGAALALAGIREELLANHASVLASEEYHRMLQDSLVALQQRSQNGNPDPDPLAAGGRIFSGGFTRPASLLHTAWDAAGAADAVRHMSYGDVLLIARVYEEQQEYRQQANQIGQLIYSQLFTEGFQGVVRNRNNLSTLIATFWYRECQLLHRYSEVLPQLSTGPANTAGMADTVPERCREVPAR
jgi:hypothetical protein